ncbi:MAG: hypothetical protein R2856_05960 [Caldilineaceae bacterium]
MNINQFELSPGQTHVIKVGASAKYAALPSGLSCTGRRRRRTLVPGFLIVSVNIACSKLYRTRMWIEEMYGDLKGHGFDLEATQLDDLERISRLFLGVCLTFVWLIATGSRVVKARMASFC